MPALKFWDPMTQSYKEILSGQKGEKGDKGDPGQDGAPGAPGAPGGFGPLDQLSDVSAPASTPVGKVLGTTATGAWAPIDPPPTGLTQADADLRYVNVTGDSMSGTLFVTFIDSQLGMNAQGKITNVTAPTAAKDGANKKYVDDRIWKGTQAQYDAIVTKDPAVLYVIVA